MSTAKHGLKGPLRRVVFVYQNDMERLQSEETCASRWLRVLLKRWVETDEHEFHTVESLHSESASMRLKTDAGTAAPAMGCQTSAHGNAPHAVQEHNGTRSGRRASGVENVYNSLGIRITNQDKIHKRAYEDDGRRCLHFPDCHREGVDEFGGECGACYAEH